MSQVELSNRTSLDRENFITSQGQNRSQETTKLALWTKLLENNSYSELFLVYTGFIASILHGIARSFVLLFVGDMIDCLTQHIGDPQQLMDAVGERVQQMLILAAVAFVSSYWRSSCWTIFGARQGVRIRKMYFRALLEQGIAFHDSFEANELANKFNEECSLIEAFGNNHSIVVRNIATGTSSLIILFAKEGKLALIIEAFFMVIICTFALFSDKFGKISNLNSVAPNEAKLVAEDAITGIQTVVSLGGENREIDHYKEMILKNERIVKKSLLSSSIISEIIFLILYGFYSGGIYIGSFFIENKSTSFFSDKPYSGGDLIAIMCIIFSTVNQVDENTTSAITKARAAGGKIFEIIDRKSEGALGSPKGLMPDKIKGNIRFENVCFAYPRNPEKSIFNSMSFNIRRNSKTALVGQPGSGKTACMELIQRFYDISSGSIMLDGNELKDLNFSFLRYNIGYLGQEPVLFPISIRENLLMTKPTANDDELWEALKNAGAYEFVRSLPYRLDTIVDAEISSGDKQRLAIARTVLKDPKILLLDDVTRGLDRYNEITIERILEKISEGRTTIVVCNRMTSIVQSADHIIVFDDGNVVEEGRHEELMENRKKYYSLYKSQADQIHEAQEIEVESENNENEIDEQVKEKISKSSLPENDLTIIEKSLRTFTETLRYIGDEQDLTTRLLNRDQQDLLEGDRLSKRSKKRKDILIRLFQFNKAELPLICLGVFISAIGGVLMVLVNIILSNMIDILAWPDSSDFREKANSFCFLFFILSICISITKSLEKYCFGIVDQNFSVKVRIGLFKKILKMPMKWFEAPSNSPENLLTLLDNDVNLASNFLSFGLGLFVEAVVSCISGLAISFVANWKLNLIMIFIFCLVVVLSWLISKLEKAFEKRNQESNTFVAEAMKGIKTLVAFGSIDIVSRSFCSNIDLSCKALNKKATISGIASAFHNSINIGLYVITFYLMALFLRDSGVTYRDLFQSFFALTVVIFSISNLFGQTSKLRETKNAAANIFKILHKKSDTILDDDSNQTLRTPINGNIEFRNVWFKHPIRKTQTLKGVSFHIKAASTVAIVESGCKNSVVLALLQRFYEPNKGEILIDGINIKDYNLRYLRECYGVVSQEPMLFNGTIEYNIKYAKENATNEQMKEAAQQANALEFIQNNNTSDLSFSYLIYGNLAGDNPIYMKGFERKVGSKESQLSRSERKRIGLARAILRDPSILIFDRMDGIQDNKNEEKAVQESLDRITKYKTCIILAQAISAVNAANVDEIIVIDQGEIVRRVSN